MNEGYAACVDELARRELARRNYADYLGYVGGAGWKRTRFSDFLARRVQEFLEEQSGRAYDILLIEAPPQHGKSMAVTEALPSWYLGKYPGRRVILASYNDETAERFARRNREKLQRFGRALFGVELGEVRRATEFEVVRAAGVSESAAPASGPAGTHPGGWVPPPDGPAPGSTDPLPPAEATRQRGRAQRVAGGLSNQCPGKHENSSRRTCSYEERSVSVSTGMSGQVTGQAPQALGTARTLGRLISRGLLAGITGNPADLLIIDDPVKNRQEADSESRRKLVWEEWLSSLKSRLSAGARAVVIMTPWHEDDLAGRLLRREKNIRLLRLPAEAGPDDPLGRAPGDPLCPELGKGKQWLRQFKQSYLSDPEGGPRAWAALYQCAPRTEEGEIVKRGWWKRFDPAEARGFGTGIISVDAAFKGGENNDFVAVQVWGKRGNDYFCRYCLNRHLDFPGTVEAIRTVKKLFPSVGAVLIEDKANGSAVISVLQKEMFCIPVTPKGGKLARVHAVSPAIESGHVFLPEGAGWAEEFIDQFAAFPAGKHDDMVDAASQALSWLIWSSGEPPEDEGEPEEALLDNEKCYDIYDGGFL